jgi:hypothetical protein
LDKQTDRQPIQVKLPDGTRICSSHTAVLAIPTLPATARQARILPNLQHSSLLSVGQLCDHQLTVSFTANAVTVTDSDQNTVLQGQRNIASGLYHVPLQTTPAQANSAYHTKSNRELIKYLHQCCFCPSSTTWTTAIAKGFFSTWPGLTEHLVRHHLPKSTATSSGHLRQQYQNIRSTRQAPPRTTTAPAILAERTNDVFSTVYQPTGRIYTDQTGRFPVTSSRGNRYIMIMYDYDSNAILSHPMKNRSTNELTQACSNLLDLLLAKGIRPKLHRLDNEAPAKLKALIVSKGLQYQLVPPGIHRRNSAERAISTWKDHFIAGLSTTDKQFPLHLWCRLLPQCDMTLNMLRASRVNPHISAYQLLHGTFDFNATPLAPPGTKAIIHEKPANRTTWAPHGIEGWYVEPAMEHYRCYKVYCPTTKAVRVSDTVELFTTHCQMPAMTTTEAAIKAATDLASALQTPTAPFQTIGNAQLTAIQKLAKIFQLATVAPAPRVPTVPSPTTTAPAPRVPTASTPPITSAPTPRVPIAATPAPRVPIAATPAPRVLTPHLPRTPLPTVTQEESDWQEADTPPPTRPRTRGQTGAIPRRHWTIPIHTANSVIDERTGKSYEYRHLISGQVNGHSSATWSKSFANEIGRLAQGVGTRIPAAAATNTIHFVPFTNIPRDRKVTYGRIVCSVRPQKAETHRTRLTVGGNLIEYPFDVSTPTAELTTAKCLFNSVVSTPYAKFMTIDIKDFYLNTEMNRYEYMKIPIKLLPTEITEQYKLHEIAHNGFAHMEIRKGMYGLPQAGMIANVKLTKHLAKYGYRPVPHTPGLWTHDQRPITFSLVVDDFGVKYVGEEHVHHLIKALQTIYKCTIDWKGELYCGVTLKWDYIARTVEMSMPGYIEKALHKFQHPIPTKPQHAPAPWERPIYGATTIAPKEADTSPPLDTTAINRMRQVVGTILYYARAVDPTMLTAVNDIAAQQSCATEDTAAAMNQLLDYCATHPNATIVYHRSDMILHADSDASYLSLPKARSRAGGHFYLSATPMYPNKAPTTAPPHNGPLHTVCNKMQNVMSSAAEAEVGALFINCTEATAIRTTLTEMGHPQPPTPMKTDNSTATGIINNTMKQRRTRAMDMRFYWVRDRVQQQQFIVYWAPGKDNLADYFTKHHPASHHRLMRNVYLKPTPDDSKQALDIMIGIPRGCIESHDVTATSPSATAINSKVNANQSSSP